MKKLLAILLAAAMVMCLGACGGDESDELNVGVFYYTYSDAYISSVRAELDKQLTAAGIKYTNYDCNNTQATQNDYISTALSSGCNLLIVNLVTSGSPSAAEKIIELAGDVPVIFFNRAVEADGEEGAVLGAHKNICFIGTDAPEAGHLQGKMIGEYVLANYDALDLNKDGVISYAMFKGDEANVEAIYRTQYGIEDANKLVTDAGKPAMTYFDPNNSSKYQVDQTGNWSAQAASDYMNTNLASFNESNKNMIELIICNNDEMALGCVSALNTAGFNLGDGGKTIPVFGVDATDAAKELILAGKMTGTVKQDAEGMATAIVETAKAIGGGSTMADALASIAGTKEIYSIAEGIANKLFVAYAPFTGK